MGKYIIKRLLIAIPTLFGITILAYVVSSMAPGSPLDLLLANPYMTADEIERQRVMMGLDQNALVQYFNWLIQLLHGNMGYSFRTNLPVASMIQQRIGPTLLLTFSAMSIAIVIAIPLGIISATKPYSKWDYASSGISFLGVAMPSFFTSLIFIYIFSVLLSKTIFRLPIGGMYITTSRKSLGDLIHHLVMPAFVLSFSLLGSLIRHVRSSMLEVMQENFIRTAKAKGLKRNIILYQHALRNALIPVITILGMSIPFLIGGAVITEQIFSWPGMGSMMIQAINARDYPVIMGATLIIGIAVLVGNLVTDLIYAFLNPTIRFQ